MFAGNPLYPVAITRLSLTRTHPHLVEGSFDQEQTSWAIRRKRKSHFVRFGLEIDDVFSEGFCKLIAEVFPCVKFNFVMFGRVNEAVPRCLQLI